MRRMVQRLVLKVATPKQQREGGGFLVRRPIGGVLPSCDPILMMDHFGPVTHKPGEAIGAPDHPHRGFETVTYILEGEMQHKDSAGNSGNLGPGWVQWMTAGRGVVHAEMPSDKIMKEGGRIHGFQLWVNLPAKDKMIAPRYQDTPPEKIPMVTTSDGKVRVKVIAGESLGKKAYIETRIPIMYLDIHLESGQSFTQHVPKSYNAFAYVYKGSGFLGKNEVPLHNGQVAQLGDGDEFTVRTDKEACDLLLIGGAPINESVVQHGPFVMNTQEQIEQAISDYRSGQLGQIPGMEDRLQATKAAKAKQKKSGSWF